MTTSSPDSDRNLHARAEVVDSADFPFAPTTVHDLSQLADSGAKQWHSQSHPTPNRALEMLLGHLHATAQGSKSVRPLRNVHSSDAMELLTVREVQMQLKVSRACVYSLVESGQLPCVRIGTGRGTIRIDRADLDQFVNSQRSRRVKKTRPIAARGVFQHLDADRLREAWTGNQKE